MTIAECTPENVNDDYWFLRSNGLRARTAMKMIRIAYSNNEVKQK